MARNKPPPASLGAVMPYEISRVEQLRALYAELPPASQFMLHAYIDPALEAARKALADNDAVAMLYAYKGLKRITE